MDIVAAYPGSFDPVTNGHVDIINRASKLFSKLYVIVGTSSEKSPLFSIEERLDLLKKVLKGKTNIEIIAHDGLTVVAATQLGARVLIRGVRSGADHTSEMAMAQMNRCLESGLETIFFPTKSEFFHVSSSLVKDVAKHGGNLALFVPEVVARKLEEKFNIQN